MPDSPYWGIVDRSISGLYADRVKGLLSSDDCSRFFPLSHIADSPASVGIRESANNPYDRVDRLFPGIQRLFHIKQYGTSEQFIGGDGSIVALQGHTRYVHSFEVALSAERMGMAMKLSKTEIGLLVFSGLLHDYATPCFGDLTKKIFPDIKSEETNFLPYLEEQIAYLQGHGKMVPMTGEIDRELGERYGISLREIHETIKGWIGGGICGEVLDIADRFGYTLTDASNFTQALRIVTPNPDNRDHIFWSHRDSCEELEKILRLDPELGRVFESVFPDPETGRPVFWNAKKAADILTLRANLHRMVYLNAHNWWAEHFIGLVLAFVTEQKRITRERILFGTLPEWWLETVSDEFGIPIPNFTGGHPCFTTEVCSSDAEAHAKKAEHLESGTPAFIKKIPKFSSGMKYLGQKDGIIAPLNELFPEVESHIRDIAEKTFGYAVYALTEDGKKRIGNPDFLDFLWKRARE